MGDEKMSEKKSFIEIYLKKNNGKNVVFFIDFHIRLNSFMNNTRKGIIPPPRKIRRNEYMTLVPLEKRLKLDINENLTVVNGSNERNFSIFMRSDTEIRVQEEKLIFRVKHELLDLWIETDRVLMVIDWETGENIWDEAMLETKISKKFNDILNPKKQSK